MSADVHQLSREAAAVAMIPLWPLSDDELADVLRAAHRLTEAGAALRARVVHQADIRRMPGAQGHRTVAGWVRSQLRLDPQPARELAEHATVVGEHPVLEQAVLDGQVDLRQAAVIAATVAAVPGDLADVAEVGVTETRQIASRAQTTMIEMAGQLPAFQLRRVGERILFHVAPQVAEQAERAALARQEARNQQRRGLSWSTPVDGLTRLTGWLDAEDAATMRAALDPLCAPVPHDTRTAPQRRVDALMDVFRLALRTGELPEDGGEPPQVNVTVAYDPLARALGAATTDTGVRVPAETARRMACDAKIMPVLLGGAGQILDAGRTRRTAGGPLRRALHIRDGGCAFPTCDRPARWTDVHHRVPWIAGGPTDLGNLVLLCRLHHRLLHHPTAGWQIRLGADGRPEFIPPPAVDAEQRPRRNLYHRRQ